MIDFEEEWNKVADEYRLVTANRAIIDNDEIEVVTTGHPFDAIATVLNKTGYHIVIDFFDYEESIKLKPYDHCLLLMDADGRAQLLQFLFHNFRISFGEEETL